MLKPTTKSRKLPLTTQTVRSLSGVELGAVAGGGVNDSDRCSGNCPTHVSCGSTTRLM